MPLIHDHHWQMTVRSPLGTDTSVYYGDRAALRAYREAVEKYGPERVDLMEVRYAVTTHEEAIFLDQDHMPEFQGPHHVYCYE